MLASVPGFPSCKATCQASQVATGQEGDAALERAVAAVLLGAPQDAMALLQSAAASQ